MLALRTASILGEFLGPTVGPRLMSGAVRGLPRLHGSCRSVIIEEFLEGTSIETSFLKNLFDQCALEDCQVARYWSHTPWHFVAAEGFWLVQFQVVCLGHPVLLHLFDHP